MSADPGRGAHWGSGGIRSTGQTGPNSTVPVTPEPALAPAPAPAPGTVVAGAVVTTGRPTPVVVVGASLEPEDPTNVVEGASVVVRLAPDRNAASWLPQAAPAKVMVITRAENPSRRRAVGMSVSLTLPVPLRVPASDFGAKVAVTVGDGGRSGAGSGDALDSADGDRSAELCA